MSPALPDGETVPDDGALPVWVAEHPPSSPEFGVYLHVPFCRVRCGYCDFTTYTAGELGGGATRDAYAQTAVREIELAGQVLGGVDRGGRAATTVFFGGGTPAILPPGDLARMLDAVRATWGIAPGAEVTVEANPDSVDERSIGELAAAGVTRMSIGMQSAVPHVLDALDRTHRPEGVADAVRWAAAAGLDASVDLIYGAPGESVSDWRVSVESAVELGVDHVSAYALTVEPGTRLAVQVRNGLVPAPDPDDQAAKYEVADAVLSGAGLQWYEVSNWARTPALASRHNLGYWHGVDWWGIGPGAHSHVAAGDRAVRWWNVKHPRAYAARLEAGSSPAAGREQLDADEVRMEQVMLGVRLREGLDLDVLSPTGRRAVAGMVADGLLGGGAALHGRAVLTRRGRLLADAVVRALTH